MLKGTLFAAALAVAGPALAQSGTTYQQPYTPPAQPPPAQQPPQQPPAQQPPAQGGTTAAPGGASQQVVVNPPSEQQGGTTTTAPPPSTTTVVTPPPAGRTETEVIVERREPPNPMATVATDAAYGGVAGLLVGTGVALINEWDDWQRDVMIGAGAGLLVGAAVGVVHATYEAREADRRNRRLAARDGLGTTDRDPIVTAPSYVGWAGRF